MRKCLAVLLSLLMLLGTMPASSFAAELDIPESAAAEAEPAGDQFTEAAEPDVPEQEELPEPEDPESAGTESGSEEEQPAEEGEPDVSEQEELPEPEDPVNAEPEFGEEPSAEEAAEAGSGEVSEEAPESDSSGEQLGLDETADEEEMPVATDEEPLPEDSEQPAEPDEVTAPAENEEPEEESTEDVDPEKGPAKAPLAAPVEKTIVVDLVDRNGDPLPASAVGRGFDLNYYEFPSSALQQSSYTSPVEMYEAMEPYRKTIHIDAQSKRLTLTMEADATEEDPYVLVFQIGTTWKDTPAAIANMIPYYTEASSWVGMFSMQYDGREISQMQGVTLEDGAYHGKVIYFGALSDVTTQMTFSTGDYPDDDAYPLYARVTLLTPAPYPNSDGRIMSGPFPYISTTTVKVTGEGTIEATLKDIANDYTRNLIAYTSTPTNLVVQLFKDEACTEQLDDWRMASNHSGEYNQNGADHIFHVTIDSDNHLRMYTTSQICKPLFEKEATVFKPAVKVAAIDQGGFADSSAFPLYAKVKLTAEHEGETTELEQVVAINSPLDTYDRAQYTDVSFDGYVHKEATITIEYDLYKDEACTEKAEGWKYYSPLEYVSYYADEGRLSDDELVFTYNLTSLDFDVEAYSSLPQEDYPAYVKVTLTTFDENSDPLHEYTQVLPFTGNDRKTAAFTEVDRGAWSSAMVSYAVYTDADCTTPHAYWSEETVWNGYIQEKGGFWSYDEEMVKDTIGLSHVATK
ncbi:MAG: hypothetical protein K5707_07870, partial [Clostridia bacterium]|nr:hypothetical protein [Clostridia bacterium]